MESLPQERPLGELFAELARETGQLFRQEAKLVQAEMTQKAEVAARHAAWVGAGGVLAQAGLFAVVAGVILLIGQFVPLWVSALLVGAAVTGGGYLLVQRGLHGLKAMDLAPRQTLQTLKEDRRWVQQQTQ